MHIPFNPFAADTQVEAHRAMLRARMFVAATIRAFGVRPVTPVRCFPRRTFSSVVIDITPNTNNPE